MQWTHSFLLQTDINSVYLHLGSRYAPIAAFSQLARCLFLEPSSLLETSIIKLSQASQGSLIDAVHSVTCRAGDILNALLDVGDNSTANSVTNITCGTGLSPVGFSASSMCTGITTFQVCAKP